MSREEIRKGIERILDELLFSGDGSLNEPFEEGECVSNILEYLHSQGVVIKVDRELPFDTNRFQGITIALDVAGYVAVEPLMEG